MSKKESSSFDVLSILQDANETSKETPNESSKESPEETHKETSKESSKEPPKESSNEPPKEPPKKSGKTPNYIKELSVAISESPVHKQVVELTEKLNQKIAESGGKKSQEIPIYEPTVYKYKDSIYTTLTGRQKDSLKKKVNDAKEKFKGNQEISDLAGNLYENIDKYENKNNTENDLKTEIRGGKIVVYKEVKPQMTVQNYIDELAQLDAFAIPEEKLRQGLENAIDNKIIGLDKNKIDSAIDSIYSKSLLFNKKLKKILEDTPEEELLGKIPPDVLKRLKKIRGEKQDIKNRKYKLFKKPPPREYDEKPRENFDGPPYGLNPLLLRGVRVLTNQFV